MNRQAGFSIIAAVFILVVLGGLGTVMVQLSTTQHLGAAMSLEGRQAWYSARAGAEWARYRIMENQACSSTQTIAGFNVVIQCTPTEPTREGASTVTIYHVTSTASKSMAGAGEVKREVRLAVWRGA